MTRKFDVKKARPGNTYVRMALVGAAGSGKTFSALRLATGFGGKVVVIDTENRRSEKYAKRFDFSLIDFQPPFNPDSYGDAIQSALEDGAKTVIVDSMSHEHEGEGGVLEMAEDWLNKRAGDDYKRRENLKFASWILPKRARTQLIVSKIQRVPANIILCFRAKEVTKPMRNAQGKIEPIKEWDMIGGDEYRYEMDVTAFLPSGSEGVPDWSNSMKRINDADGSLKKLLMESGQLTEELGRKIKAMNTGSIMGVQEVKKDAPPAESVLQAPEETPEQKTKRVAKELVAAIQACSSLGELENVRHDFERDIEGIKSASQKAYDYIMGADEAKAHALES